MNVKADEDSKRRITTLDLFGAILALIGCGAYIGARIAYGGSYNDFFPQVIFDFPLLVPGFLLFLFLFILGWNIRLLRKGESMTAWRLVHLIVLAYASIAAFWWLSIQW